MGVRFPAMQDGKTSGTRRAPTQRHWRELIIPKTLLGMLTMLLVVAIAIGSSGAAMYTYYQYRLQKTERRVDNFIARFDERYDKALEGIAKEREAAKADVRKELEPIQELRASGEKLEELLKEVEKSVFFVETRDELGQPSVGSAFVVSAESDRAYLLTSLTVVRASTALPNPEVRLRKGERTFGATVWTWDDEYDLALLLVKGRDFTRLPWAPEKPAVQIGQRVFAISGIGGSGGAIAQGFVADVFNGGLLTDTPISGAVTGAPLLNSKGEVIGVASREYEPLGFSSDRLAFAPPIRSSCNKVLRCPSGGQAQPADQR